MSLAEVEQKPRPSACKDPDPAPSASARGLTGSAPAESEAAADYLDAAPGPFAHTHQRDGDWPSCLLESHSSSHLSRDSERHVVAFGHEEAAARVAR